MARFAFRASAAAALTACASMIATPALAAPVSAPTSASSPVSASPTWDSARDTVQDHRWDGRGGYRYYGRGHRHHDGIDAGDVLAGVLILGGIAAIASAASNANKNRDYRDQDYRDGDYRDRNYPDDRNDYRGGEQDSYSTGRGIDDAVDSCVGEIERKDQVDSVEGVQRSAGGWAVDGTLRDGRSFTCTIDGSGQVRGIEYGRGFDRRSETSGGQWGDDEYARARESQQDAPFEGGI